MEENKLATIQENNKVDNDEIEKTVTEISNVKQMSPTRMVLRRFFRSKLSIIGLIIVVFLFVFSFLGPYILMALDKIDFLGIISVWGETEPDPAGSIIINETLITFVGPDGSRRSLR